MGKVQSLNCILDKDFKTSQFQKSIPFKKGVPKMYNIKQEIYFENDKAMAWQGKISKLNKQVVIKKTRKNKFNERSFKKEIFILEQIDHPNIAQIYEFFQTDKSYFIVYPYFKGRPVIDYYLNNKDKMNIDNYKIFMKHLIETLSFIHKRGIAHLNLESKYILWNGSDLQICGFSNAITKSKKKRKIGKTNFFDFSNCYYLSPEIINGSYDYKSDIWVCGILFYLLISGNTPFVGNSRDDLKNAIVNKKLKISPLKKKGVSKVLIELIQKMLIKNPSKRPDCDELLKSDFFKEDEINLNLSFNDSFELIEDDINLAFSGLKNYRRKTKFYHYFKLYCGQKFLNHEEKKSFKDLFCLLDRENNGYVNRDDIKTLADKSSVNINEEQIKEFCMNYESKGKKLGYS